MDITIAEKYNGRALLSYLKFTLKISSTCITKLKKHNTGLSVNGDHVTVRYILRTGDILHIGIEDIEDDSNQSIVPMPIPLDIIYEDESYLVVNKPPFMPTHPSHNHHDDTLANGVAHLYATRGLPFIFRPVGRLDRNTSGIVVLGKNMPAAAHFSGEREKGEVRKSYIAILEGEIDTDEGVIDTPLRRVQNSVIIRAVCSPEDDGSMSAITQWTKLYSGHDISLVRAYPKTGRTHQLRVHFASIGHPILSDELYGKPSEYISRHALHAQALRFTLPFSSEEKHLFADIPRDIHQAFLSITGEDITKYIR